MKLRKLMCSGILLFGLGALAYGQAAAATADSGAMQQPDQGAKSDMKDAGHDTARAAKTTGNKVKKGTKKATHKTAQKARQGSEKVEDKSATPPQE